MLSYKIRYLHYLLNPSAFRKKVKHVQELLALGRKAGVIRLINRTKRKPGTSGKRLNLLLVALDWSPDAVSYGEPCGLGDQQRFYSVLLTPHCSLSPVFQA